MNGKGSIITNLIILLAGVLLCWLSNRPHVLHTIIFITGIIFIVPALINIVMLFGHSNSEEKKSYVMKVVDWITSGAGIILGICLVLSPDFFLPILVYLFGAIAVLGGLFQIYMLSYGFRPVKFPATLYIIPVVLLVGGVVMLFTGHYGEDGVGLADQTVLLMTGIGMILFAINTFVTKIMYKSFNSSRKSRPDHAIESGDSEPADHK